MLKRTLFSIALFLATASATFAQSVGMPSVGGYWSTTGCGTGPSPCFVQYGGAAAGATDSGSPVKVGGVFNTTAPTYTNGQRGNLELTNKGETIVRLSAAGALIQAGNPSDALANGIQTHQINNLNSDFNGATWDRQFTCPSSATVSVTAAATTQIVALSGATIVRVCSFVITGSVAATTATWVYGTGADCGTGQVALTGAMRMPLSGSIAISAGNGSLFRGIAGNALCLTAATGNVTGFVTFAQY